MAERVEKPELVRLVARRVDRDAETVAQIVDAFLDETYEALKRGESVSLRGFGSFYVRPERGSWVFKFNPSQRLRVLFGWSSTHRGPLWRGRSWGDQRRRDAFGVAPVEQACLGVARGLTGDAGDNTGVDAPAAVVARILAAADQLQPLPVGADLDAVRGVFPEAAQAIETAGVQVARLLVGEGMWDRAAAPESERDFDLVVRGPRAAIEWLAAMLGKHGRAGDAASQCEVLVAYLVQPDGTPAATFLVADAGPEPIRAFRRAARALRGWHVGYTTDGRLAEIFVLGRGADPAEFAARMERVRAAFEAEGVRVAALRLEAAAVVSLGREDYDAVIARGRGAPDR